MFDSLEARAVGLGAAEILTAARATVRARIEAENEQLLWAVAWADAHAVESIDPAQLDLDGGARPVRPGGDGTPEVDDLSIVTFAAAIEKGVHTARQYLGQALDLRHRFPLLWGKIMRSEVIGWQGCQIARLTRALLFDQARCESA